jgi:hypothetical protein
MVGLQGPKNWFLLQINYKGKKKELVGGKIII